MKKIILTTITLTSLASAGMWSTAVGLTMPKKKLTSEYVIDTNGFNPRVYEFTTNNGMNCVIVFSSSDESSAPTMQCTPNSK